MITVSASVVYLVLVANAVLLGIASISIIRFELRCLRIEQFWTSPTGTALIDDKEERAQEYLRATRRFEECMDELRETVRVLSTKTPRSPAASKRSLPIENAVRMARLGASVDDLGRSCGLNIGEAQLMHKLHGKPSPAATASD